MRKLLATLIMLSTLVPLCTAADTRTFFGISFNYDMNMLSPELQEELDGIAGAFNGEDVTGFHTVGPRIELVLFPFDKVPLGLGVTSVTGLTVGYMSAGGGDGYFSRNFDFRQDLGANLSYQQSYGNWGLFLSGGLSCSWYRIATSNEANSRGEVEYVRLFEWGVCADLGVYLENHTSFFKVGTSFFYNLSQMDGGLRFGLMAGGGFLF